MGQACTCAQSSNDGGTSVSDCTGIDVAGEQGVSETNPVAPPPTEHQTYGTHWPHSAGVVARVPSPAHRANPFVPTAPPPHDQGRRMTGQQRQAIPLPQYAPQRPSLNATLNATIRRELERERVTRHRQASLSDTDARQLARVVSPLLGGERNQRWLCNAQRQTMINDESTTPLGGQQTWHTTTRRHNISGGSDSVSDARRSMCCGAAPQ